MQRCPRRLSGQPASWAALWVLGGLLAMHGLGSHQTGVPGHDAHHSAAESSMAGMVMGTPATPTTTPTTNAAPPSLTVTAPDAPAPGHLLAACVVVLGLALLVGLGAVPTTRVLGRSGPLLLPDLIRARARDPDQPDLVTLSVCRC